MHCYIIAFFNKKINTCVNLFPSDWQSLSLACSIRKLNANTSHYYSNLYVKLQKISTYYVRKNKSITY